MKGERQNDISELLAFAGSRKVLTFIGLILSGISMLFSMVPYICIPEVLSKLLHTGGRLWTYPVMDGRPSFLRSEELQSILLV